MSTRIPPVTKLGYVLSAKGVDCTIERPTDGQSCHIDIGFPGARSQGSMSREDVIALEGMLSEVLVDWPDVRPTPTRR